MFNDYQLGLMYGGGTFLNEGFRFYTSHKYIYEYLMNILDCLLIDYGDEITTNESNEQELKFRGRITITDEKTLLYLKECGLSEEKSENRFKVNPEYIRGYLESNGSFYTYLDKGVTLWRCNFSGKLDDLERLKNHFDSIGIQCRKIEVRKTKKPNGTISITYRLSVGARKSIIKLVEYLNTEVDSLITIKLREKFDEFLQFDRKHPKRTGNDFTRARYAVEAMCRVLKFELKKSEGNQPYMILISCGNDEWMFNGYKEAYEYIAKVYEDQRETEAPTIL